MPCGRPRPPSRPPCRRTARCGANADGTTVNDHTDWARPMLTCGAAGPDDRWAWTNPHTSRTITAEYAHLTCPAGVTVDPARIRAIWVFLNGVNVYIDNIRAA